MVILPIVSGVRTTNGGTIIHSSPEKHAEEMSPTHDGLTPEGATIEKGRIVHYTSTGGWGATTYNQLSLLTRRRPARPLEQRGFLLASGN